MCVLALDVLAAECLSVVFLWAVDLVMYALHPHLVTLGYVALVVVGVVGAVVIVVEHVVVVADQS